MAIRPDKSDTTRRLLISYEAADGNATSAVARDAALGGLFIETKTPLPIGTLLSVELKSARSDARSVTLEARVFAIQHDGMSVRFLDLPASALATLQSILEHHRPPARTQLGVGDEKDALWAAAGGRDDHDSSRAIAEPDDAIALAGSLVVDGRPTMDPLPPLPEPNHEPMPPRYPTPRMVPIATGSQPSPPSSLAGHVVPTTSPPSLMPQPNAVQVTASASSSASSSAAKKIITALVAIVIVMMVALFVAIVVFARRRAL